MSWEKSGRPGDIIHWHTEMEVEKHVYTAGLAGNVFFRELRENGRIVGGKCRRCNRVYVPPKGFCERCFEPVEEFVDLGIEGYIKTYTIVSIDMKGEPLEEPVIVAFIGFDGAEGGIIHFIGEARPEKLRVGARVEAVFRPREERRGSIFDIEYFRLKR